MKKYLWLILIGIILFVFLGVILVWITFTQPIKKPSPSPSPTPIPAVSVQPAVTVQPETIRVGQTTVRNFYTFKKETNTEGDVLIDDKPDFQIVYFPEDSRFLLSILSEPFQESRIKAESQFLRLLGINSTAACALSVEITTPYDVNPDETGKSFPLSFCER